MANASEIFWTAGFLNERFSAPVSPLGWSVVGPLFEQIALRQPLRYMGYPDADRIPATRLVRGHPYTNVLIFQVIYNLFPDVLVPADTVRYFPDGDLNWRKRAPYPRTIKPRFLLSLLWHLGRDPINVSPLNFWQWQRYTRLHDQRVAALHARLDRAHTPREIFDVLARARQADTDLLRIHRWSLTYADVFYKLLTRWAGAAAPTLISDVPNLTARVDQDLRALARLAAKEGLSLEADSTTILADPRGREFKIARDDFLRAHGHRAFSLDIAQPTFRDEPAQFLRLLADSADPQPAAENWMEAQRRVRSSLPVWQIPFFDLVLAFARRYASLREDQRYYWQKSLAVIRRAYLMLAETLFAQDVISSRADIFYATRAEINAYFDGALAPDTLQQAMRTRRVEWARYHAEYLASPARAYPAFLRGDLPLEGEDTCALELWQGRGVSPGFARGKARVIIDAGDLGKVERGEILVAPTTDPGWTPVFVRLAGLVLERGGVLAHGAVVAREYHLPAVAGVPNITRALVDGDWIEVDGTRGTIKKTGSSRPAA